MSKELRDAVRAGDVEKVMRLVQQVNVNEKGPGGITPLHIACYMSRFDLAQVLYSRGARVDIEDGLKLTPFALSNLMGPPEFKIYQFFDKQKNKNEQKLTQFQNANLHMMNNRSEIETAIGNYGEFLEKARLEDERAVVVDSGVAVTTAAMAKATLKTASDQLLEALKQANLNRNPNILSEVMQLIQAGANVNAAYQRSGTSALMLAVQFGQMDVIQLLVEKGAIIDYKASTGLTALMLADNKPEIKAFLEKQLVIQKAAKAEAVMRAIGGGPARTSARASATRAEERPENPIFEEFIEVAKSGHQQRIRQLLRADPSIINMQDEEGMTALMYAVQNDHRDVIDILINSGARTDLYNKKGEHVGEFAKGIASQQGDYVNTEGFMITSLFSKGGPEAADNYFTEFVRSQVRKRVEVSKRTDFEAALNEDEDKSKVQIFRQFRNAALRGMEKNNLLEGLLRDNPAIKDMQDEKGMTALMHAASIENFAGVLILLKAGADYNLVNKKGEHVGMMVSPEMSSYIADVFQSLEGGGINGRKYKAGLQMAQEMKEQNVGHPSSSAGAPRTGGGSAFRDNQGDDFHRLN